MMTKRFVTIMVSIFMIVSTIPMSISANTEGYYTYAVENGEVTIVNVNTLIQGDVEIPDILGGYPVTKIDVQI